MPVLVEKHYTISIDNSPQWKVPADAIKVVEGAEFVKVTPYDQSFVKLLCFGCLQLPKNAYKLSAASLDGFREVLRLRNAAAFKDVDGGDAPELMLFASTAATPKAKARRLNAAQLKDMRDAPSVFEFEVPGAGDNPPLLVSMLRPIHPCDDLSIKLDEDTLEHVVAFIRDQGITVDTLTTRRQYGTEEPGTWRMGNGKVVRKVLKDADTDDDPQNRPKFKTLGAKKRSASEAVLGDSDSGKTSII